MDSKWLLHNTHSLGCISYTTHLTFMVDTVLLIFVFDLTMQSIIRNMVKILF